MAEIGDFFNRTSKEGFTVNDVTPFLPSIDYVFDDAGFLDSYDVKFNQGYYINRTSSSQVQDKQKIEQMGKTYSLPIEHEVNYFVELIINADNFLVSKATFTGVSGEGEGGEGTSAADDLVTDFPHILFDQTDTAVTEFTGYFPVCKLKDGSLEEYTQRSNIQLSDRQFRQLGAYLDGTSALPFVDEGHHDEGNPVRVRNIVAGTGVYITQSDASIVINSEGGGESTGESTGACVNIGSAVEVYNDGAPSLDPQQGFEFRTLIGSESNVDQNNVEVSIDPRNGDRILISGGSCENVGSYVPVYVDGSIRDFKFRSLEGRGTVTVEQQGDTHVRISGSCCDLQTTTDYGSTTTNPVTFGPTAPATPIGSYPVSIITKSSSLNGLGVFSANDLTHPIHELQEDSSYNGEHNMLDSNGNLSAKLSSNSSKEGKIETYNAAGSQAMNVMDGDGAGNPLLKQTNTAGTIVNQIAGKSDTDTYFDAGPVAIGDNSTVAGKSLYVKGTTRIQDSSTAGDGTLEFGNDSTHSIGYSNSKSALTVGAGVTKFDADHSETIDFYSNNAASYSSQNGHLEATSPATGSAILAGSGNSISGHYNVIVGGANQLISGKSMNFIGGGSGVDIINSEFAVSVGGRNNDISGADWSVIAGGYNNTISGKNTNSIGGGYSNEIRGVFASVIAGGYDNLVSGNLESAGAIVGGVNNKVEKSHYGFVGAGASNTIQEESDGAVIVGGLGNTLYGTNSFIGGGRENVVSGTYGVALGSFSKVTHNGAFVFTDGIPLSAFSSGDNTLLMSFKSGVYVQSDSGLYVNGNPVMTGASDLDTDTLQTVTTRGDTTTTNIISEKIVSGVSGLFGDRVGIGNVNPQDFNSEGNRLVVGDGSAAQGMTIFAGTSHSASLYFADGTAGSAAYQGWVQYRHGNSRLDFGAAGGRRMSLNGNGLAIGDITSPNAELEISSSLPAIRLTDSDLTNHFSEIERAGTSLNFYSRSNASNGKFVFLGDNGTSDTEFMRIETDGDVGIGSNTPSAKLDVAGGIKLLDNNYLTWNSSNTRIVGNSSYLQLQVAASDKVRIQSDGHVGIGTTTAPSDLTVFSTDSNSATASIHCINNNATGALLRLVEGDNHQGGFIQYDGNNNKLNIGVHNTNDTTFANDSGAITIDRETAKVGIGTTTTSAHLTIANTDPKITLYDTAGANSDPNGEITFNETATSENFAIKYNGANDRLEFNSPLDGNTGIMVITRSERVGIGTTDPQKAAHIYADGNNGLRIQSSNNHAFTQIMAHNDYSAYIQFRDGANRYWVQSTTDDKLRFRPNATSLESATINFDATGNVGIGSLSPAFKLDVDGTIHGTSGNFENGITIDGNPVVTGTSAFESDTLQTVTDQGNITTNNIIIENNGNDPEYGALTISGGYALAHLRSTGTVAYLQFQNSTTSYGTMSNVGMTIGNNGHDAYVTNRQALGSVYLATSGEARVAIKPDGDVGIGSITPQGLLDVKADTDQNVFLGRARFGSHVTDYLYLSHYDNATSTSYALKQSPAGSSAINAKAGQNVSMSVNNSNIVFVQGSTSRVGIGTTGPNQLLHVDGKTQLGTNGFTEGGLLINYASLSETKGGAATLLGNAVYAGTTSNTFRRTKGDAGNYIRMTYNKGICFHTNVTGNTSDDYSIDNHEQMRITTGGFVGIGTSDPDTKLHLQSGRLTIAGNGSEAIKVTNSDIVNFDLSTVRADLFRASAISDQLEFRGGSNRTRFLNSDGGTELFTITDAGNVGIGNTNPVTYKLQVAGEIGVGNYMMMKSSATYMGMIGFNRNGNNGAILNNSYGAFQLQNHNGALNLECYNSGGTIQAEHVFKEDGKVGIGTTDPAKKLSVYEAGNAQVQITGTNVAILTISDPNSHGQLNTYNDGTFRINSEANAAGTQLVLSGSNVGIGTANPQNLLHVHKANTTGPTIELSNSEYRAYINSWGSTASAGRRDRFEINASETDFAVAADSIRFQIGTAGDSYEKMRIDSAGNVRIGTNTNFPTGTAAAGKLDVRGASDGQLVFDSDGGSQDIKASYNLELWADYDNNNSAGYSNIYFKTDGDNTRMTIDNNGKVGIGTTQPADTLQVAGQVRIDGATGDGLTITSNAGASRGLEIYNNSSTDTASIINYYDGPLVLGQSNTEVMRIHDTSNVGIGTTSPARKLDVSTNGADTYGIRSSYGASHYMEMAHNRFNTVGNNYIRFNIDDSTKMTIVDSDFGGGVNGVGIGTTSPSYELDVVGTTRSTYYIGGAYLEENASSSKLKFYTDGTVLVMDEDGELKPCEKENDTLVFGVSKRDFDSPVVLGAEPILVTGPIKVGDYIVTSSKQGHGRAMKEEKLGTIIAQAMESGDGESYNIKAMIRKM